MKKKKKNENIGLKGKKEISHKNQFNLNSDWIFIDLKWKHKKTYKEGERQPWTEHGKLEKKSAKWIPQRQLA